MATETTIRVICDRCGDIVYHGPSDDRPKNTVDMTMWGSSFDWNPKDLCRYCGEGLLEAMNTYVKTPPSDGERSMRREDE